MKWRGARSGSGGNGTVTNGASRRTVYYIVIPGRLARKLHDRLRRHFAEDESVAIVVETRRTDRRRRERRAGPGEPPPAGERRRIRNARGRRIAERRAPVVRVDPPELPSFAEPFADEILVLERVRAADRQEQDVETARLVARAQAGDREAMPELYLQHFDAVYSYMRVALRDEHEAEDATQEVFLKAMQALPRFELRASVPFRAWLFRVARNELISRVRKGRWVQVEEPDRIAERTDAATGVAEVLECVSNADLMLLLERLPLPQRQVIALRFMLDLSTEEMCTVLDRSPEAVRQLEYRARRSLEDRLDALRRRGERRRNAMTMRVRPAPVLRARRFALLPQPARVYTSRLARPF
ncbi:MAG TPA: sigma-70 family RNA polymerase sigma factor [Solirubrobacteraceae bacterium]|nr:sigma-70 family RNA polymerase sigma factor [Solirubrobacteraceae bacterium]